MIYEHEINIFNEDALKNKFSTIDTQFNVTLGKISAIISDSEIEQYVDGHTTMNTRLSSVIQDLDGVHIQVSSMRNEYQNQFDIVDHRISSAELKITDSAIISTVTETTEGQDALSSVIEQNADSIRLKADKIAWDSTHSSMTEDGVLTCTGANINGNIMMTGDYSSCSIGDATVPVHVYGYTYPVTKTVEGLIEKSYLRGALKSIRVRGGNQLRGGVYPPQDNVYSASRTAHRQVVLANNTELNLDATSEWINASTTYYFDEEFDAGGAGNLPEYEFRIFSGDSWDAKYRIYYGGGANYPTIYYSDKPETDIVGKYHYIKLKDDSIEIASKTDSASDNDKIGLWVQKDGNFMLGHLFDTHNSLWGTDNAIYHNYKKLQYDTSSSERFKHNIASMTDDEFDPHRLLKLYPKQYVYNDGHPLQYDDMEGKTLPGFIAEDVEEIYPSAAIHDHEGNVESWDERRIIPGMLALIQELYNRVENLESGN